ncbi:MAG: diaminopropionate ammonia-lyase [Proteobacteria bacterium]|nr:diaminopropionate ammonia-lyase [Pseudomonadota bacterium]
MSILPASPFQLVHNPRVDRIGPYGDARRERLGGARFLQAQAEIQSWPGYARTPCVALPALAARAGLASLHYKDEGARFGLGSFKALGGAYAVFRLLAREIERRTGVATVRAQDLTSRRFQEITSSITVTCATDGNHGRSVAWGAKLFGCRCVIWVHETVSDGRIAAIAAYGAEVRRNPGNYDDAVRRAAQTAAEQGWFVVSDTSYEGYLDVPRDVMQGYALMVDEALGQVPDARALTHVFIQGGVGGLAAAVCAHLWERFGAARPRLVVVEPVNAACLLESARHGVATAVHGSLETIMAGLSCGEPSVVAWEILDAGADDFMAIEDEPAADCMRLLAHPVGQDPPIVGGESAVAGLAGLLLAADDGGARAALGLGSASRVLVFGTEGDTDPELYRRIVGRDAASVRAGGRGTPGAGEVASP